MYGLIRWKFEIINQLVGISETIRSMLIFFELNLINLMSKLFIDDIHAPYVALQEQRSPKSPFSKNRYFFLVLSRKMSTHITTNNLNAASHVKDPDSDLAFKEWLAGLVDGDGYFTINKRKKNARFEITMDARDKNVLNLLRSKYRGIIREISNGRAVKYKLINEYGLRSLLEDINGLVKNPTRLLQMSKICQKFDMELKYSDKIKYYSGWFSGFIDSDGSIYYKESPLQVFISITQKNKFLLDLLAKTYGGRVDVCTSKQEAFQYSIYRKKEFVKLIDEYFSKYPLKTAKMKRVNLIKQFYLVKLSDKNTKDLAENINEWAKFKDKWDNFRD